MTLAPNKEAKYKTEKSLLSKKKSVPRTDILIFFVIFFYFEFEFEWTIVASDCNVER